MNLPLPQRWRTSSTAPHVSRGTARVMLQMLHFSEHDFENQYKLFLSAFSLRRWNLSPPTHTHYHTLANMTAVKLFYWELSVLVAAVCSVAISALHGPSRPTPTPRPPEQNWFLIIESRQLLSYRQLADWIYFICFHIEKRAPRNSSPLPRLRRRVIWRVLIASERPAPKGVAGRRKIYGKSSVSKATEVLLSFCNTKHFLPPLCTTTRFSLALLASVAPLTRQRCKICPHFH